ncbi:hypothetical protein BDK61_1498 [Haloarcula quadrata]|uniref:Uncharacterized protein n=1 Tax=Haloarcula quadrata TaxID=182779 RepID=A0A495R4D9_9EURY|nr:hypothetical protein BDK61_1498 [Haloarcula quadrata]
MRCHTADYATGNCEGGVSHPYRLGTHKGCALVGWVAPDDCLGYAQTFLFTPP